MGSRSVEQLSVPGPGETTVGTVGTLGLKSLRHRKNTGILRKPKRGAGVQTGLVRRTRGKCCCCEGYRVDAACARTSAILSACSRSPGSLSPATTHWIHLPRGSNRIGAMGRILSQPSFFGPFVQTTPHMCHFLTHEGSWTRSGAALQPPSSEGQNRAVRFSSSGQG